MIQIGRYVFGAGAIALGALALAWGDFNNTWHPVPADFPARTALAYASGALFLLGGFALQWRRSATIGAVVIAALYFCFVVGLAPRVIAMPLVIGAWLGFAEQIALLVAALLIIATLRDDAALSRRATLIARLAFGLCLLIFGAAHLVYVNETAAFVPTWMPLGGDFWAIATGAAHIAAGLAFLSGIQARRAGYLLTLMFIGFGALVWAPQLIGKAPEHVALGGNAINLALIGAAWVLADAIAVQEASAKVNANG